MRYGIVNEGLSWYKHEVQLDFPSGDDVKELSSESADRRTGPISVLVVFEQESILSIPWIKVFNTKSNDATTVGL